jgi:hypothetical protein
MQSFIRGSLRWTAILLIALDGTLLVVAALGTLRGRDEFWGPLVSLMGMVCVVMLWARAVRGESIEGVVIRLAGAHVVALVAISMALFPLLDRAQDLERMARFIEAASGDRPLVLWLPDETTLAMSDLYLPRPACSILSASADHAQQLATCLQQHPRSAVVALADCPEEECGSTLDLTRRSDPMQRRRLELRDATLSAAGVVAADALVRPGGRAYVVGVTAP